MGGQRKWSLVCLTLEGNNHSIRHLWPEARGKAKQNRKLFGWKKSFPCLCVSFLDLASAGNVVHRCRGYFSDLCFLTSWASSPHAHQVGILGIMGFCQMGILGTSYPPIWPCCNLHLSQHLSEMLVISNSWSSSNHNQTYKDTHETFFHLSNTNNSIDLTNTLEVSVRTIKVVLVLEWGEGMP